MGAVYEETNASSSEAQGAAPKRSLHVGAAARVPRKGMETRSPFDLSIVDDFDVLDAVWTEGFSALRADPRRHPVLLVEPPLLLPAQVRGGGCRAGARACRATHP